MRTYRYAAYGSNLHPVRLRTRVASAELLGTGVLDGHELRFHKIGRIDGSGKCNIVPGGDGVYVTIFEILESERPILDACEGLGQGYDRLEIDIEAYGTCSTYVAHRGAIDEARLPMDWYKEMVVLGCSYNEFPQGYIREIESVASIEDPDAERARRQWQIVERLKT